MFNKYRGIILSVILVAIVGFFTFPNNNVNDMGKYSKNVENLAESKYIANDAKLTTEIHLSRLYLELKDFLSNISNTNIDTEYIKETFPEVNNIVKSNKMSGYNSKLPISPIIDDKDSKCVYFQIPMNNDENYMYTVKIKLDVYEEIEDKEELRLYTVTNLQNNRWKTNPTKYSSSKNISLSFNERLPDIEPEKDEKGISHYITDEIVIKFNNNVTEEYIENFLSKHSLSLSKKHDHTIIAKCKDMCSKEILSSIEKEYYGDSNIIYCEPHFIYLSNDINNNFLFTPNDKLYLDYQWNLPSISTEQGWEKTRGNEDVIIAVIDTGIDFNHPEFKDKLVTGYNVIYPDKPPTDDDGHGTHVAGIISANTNNDEGIAGITWFNKIMPIKVLDQSGAGTLFDVAEGIFWATDHGAKVINLSLGNYAESFYLHDAIRYAYSKDVVLIAAAGNDSISDLGYPASYSEVIAVGAVNYNKRLAEFSNFGPYIDVVAPGVNIASTYPKFEYASLSGTSMACPHVSGLVGLIRANNPNLHNKEIAEIIMKTATDIGSPGKDQYYGYGEINIEKAINSSTSKKSKSIEEPPEPTNSFIEWLKKLFNW